VIRVLDETNLENAQLNSLPIKLCLLKKLNLSARDCLERQVVLTYTVKVQFPKKHF
jgi:hypothetical protein